MNRVDTPGDEVDTLQCRVCDPKLYDRFRLVAKLAQPMKKPLGNRRAAHRRKSLDLLEVRDRHDAGDYRHVNAGTSGPANKRQENIIVKKQLRNQELCTGVHLVGQMPDICNRVGGFQVLFWVASGTDAKIEIFTRKPDQICGVLESVPVVACNFTGSR